MAIGISSHNGNIVQTVWEVPVAGDFVDNVVTVAVITGPAFTDPAMAAVVALKGTTTSGDRVSGLIPLQADELAVADVHQLALYILADPTATWV